MMMIIIYMDMALLSFRERKFNLKSPRLRSASELHSIFFFRLINLKLIKRLCVIIRCFEMIRQKDEQKCYILVI